MTDGATLGGGNGNLEPRSDLPRPFGRYTLLAALGRGGMGEVFAARVDGVDKLCVVKTLPRELGLDREAVARFTDEARLVVKLNQRNIVSVFDVGVHDGLRYLAMDLVHGRDLRTIWRIALEKNKPLDPGLSLHIIAEILDGLDYAHRLTEPGRGPLKIVHRDVSPQNIMVSFEGDVKLIDFGLAASTLKIEKTESNVVMGKVAYMPPEQVHGEPVDARADVFACGVTLYELLTGVRYYEGIAPLLVSASAASGRHRPTRIDTLEPAMQDILLHATAPAPRRTESAARFAEELRAYAASRGLRGDAYTLRRMMVDLFGASPEPWQESSSSSSAASVPGSAPPATRTLPQPSLAHVRPVTNTALIAEPTAQTERVARAAGIGKNRNVAVAAAVAAAVLIIAAGVVAGRPSLIGLGDEPRVDAGVAVGVTVAPPITTTTSTTPTTTTPTPTTTTPTTTTPTTTTPTTTTPTTTTTTTTTPTSPASTPTTTAKPKRTAPKRDRGARSPMEKAEYVQKHCPSLPCASGLRIRDSSPDALERFTRNADACFARCDE